jgi:Ca2+-dependent lipid-binding protein
MPVNGIESSPSPDTITEWGGSIRYKNQPHLNVVAQYGHSVAIRENEDTPNPYIILTCGDMEFKTTAARKTIEPTWDEAFTFPIDVINGVPQETLELELWDKHTFHKDVISMLLVHIH